MYNILWISREIIWIPTNSAHTINEIHNDSLVCALDLNISAENRQRQDGQIY